ncbi:MAG TPA: alpha/beta fold hydrolase [Acidimicrobiia bacterium]|nr:alpha/beta fold hydrolase [Acidimicrobiia bacterium]
MKVESNGVTLDVEVQGDGQPLLLVHGFPDTKRLWSKMVPDLVAAGFKVITYDQRGYGASDKPEAVDAYSIPFLAMDVTAILDALSIDKAHIAGHDWGSVVVWAAATFAPERVDHLVTMSVGHPTAFAEMDMAQREKSWYMLLFQFEGIAEEWLTANDGANFREWCHHPDFDAVFADLERDKSLTPGLNYYRANVAPASFNGPPLQLPPIQSPTMGIWSSKDFALNERQMRDSGAFCANSFRYERIDGVDHWMQWEAPERVTPLFLDFLPR